MRPSCPEDARLRVLNRGSDLEGKVYSELGKETKPAVQMAELCQKAWGIPIQETSTSSPRFEHNTSLDDRQERCFWAQLAIKSLGGCSRDLLIVFIKLGKSYGSWAGQDLGSVIAPFAERTNHRSTFHEELYAVRSPLNSSMRLFAPVRSARIIVGIPNIASVHTAPPTRSWDVLCADKGRGWRSPVDEPLANTPRDDPIKS